jgi:transposase-like protein
MTQHLWHAKNEPAANPAGNTRNGKSKKPPKGDFGELPIEVPRDRHANLARQQASHLSVQQVFSSDPDIGAASPITYGNMLCDRSSA